MRKQLYFVFITALLLTAYKVNAQKYEIGILGGVSGYKGDINQFNYFKFTDPAFGLVFRNNFNLRNSLKLSLTHGKVRGEDAKSGVSDQIQRNLQFSSSINEVSAQYEFNFFKFNPFEDGQKFTPYLFTGLSVFNFDPKAEDGVRLQPLGTEGQGLANNSDKYSLTQFAVPLGIGFKANLKGQFNIFSELGYRYTFTDYIDDVSSYYANLSMSPNSTTQFYADRSLEAGYPANKPGTQRGDLNKKDMYMFGVVGISISFVSSRCPKF
ncbi:type IX secretion system protein PorG [Solitalea koreensis]|uniref:DUF6089 domain-containing protein n=1 Tax=Solitalea koreensis TaxID=543615 RepID=A0A521D2I2_9SPHI|nr:DUF6089 family protein [Solitalea koreensis]SMO65231.1 hypothetical protein SAMN06265350_10597 [Solitalea koreensis]